jgi:hypothetical protein
MLKVVFAEPAGKVIVDVRPGSSALVLARETAVPPAGAVWLKFAVQVALAPEVKLVGLQVSEDTTRVASRLTVLACETPPRVAVSVAL